MPIETIGLERRNGQGTPARNSRSLIDEYVAGGEQYAWSTQYYRSLPHYIDDVSMSFGDDLYERMMLDPQVASCVHLLKTSALAREPSFTPAVDDEDPSYGRAKEARDLCERAFGSLGDALLPTLYDLMDAIALGNRVAEIVYRRESGRLTLAALKCKPRHSHAFVVDPWMNLIGLLAIIPGEAPSLVGGTILGDPSVIRNLLPRSKFLILTFRGKNGDPRGQSYCRPAYDPWWTKQQVKPEYLKYLTQFAGPSLIGYTADQAADVPMYDTDGIAVLDEETGVQITTTPEQAMLAALQEFRNGTAAAFPFGSKVQPLEVQHVGTPFGDAFNIFDHQIAKAILGQTLATEQAEHQARAASQTHQDVLGLAVGFARRMLEGGLRYVCERLTEYNFGPSAIPLTPKVSLSETEQQDFATTGTTIARLHQVGYLHPSQLPEVDAKLDLPIRPPEAVEQAQQALEAGLQAAAQQGQNGGPLAGEEPSEDDEDEEPAAPKRRPPVKNRQAA